jgi:streptogramin lyase
MFHDLVSAPGPGGKRYGWGADFQNNGVVRVDPDTGATRWIPAPQGHAGVHSLIPDGKGHLWISLNLSNAIARFDPVAESWEVYEGFPPFGMPHSIGTDARFEVAWDRGGCLWTSLIAANKLARLCPATRQVSAFDLPTFSGQSAGYTRAYGVVLTADRSKVWFTQVGGDALGALDAGTGKLVHQKVFAKGETPRRLAIGDDDTLWVPLYGSGELLAYDGNAAREIGRWPLPERASAPYVASWDAKRKVVWIGTSNADEIYRFDPRRHAFTRYPLPRAGAFMRSIPVDPDTGVVWTSYSQIPPAAGPNVMLRLDPGD